MRGSGLYIHVPFCERKCFYCDFYSVASRRVEEDFLGALEREAGFRRVEWAGDTLFETLYIGGGTPSLLSISQLECLLLLVRRNFHLAEDAEMTIEVNPGTVTEEWLRAAHGLGLNRLSIGAQSFDDGILRWLMRIHTSREAVRTCKDARRSGFTNLSLDLIYSLPGLSIDVWERTLRKAVELAPEHISAYSLIVEPGTSLEESVRSGEVEMPGDDAEALSFEFTVDYLAAAGYEQYEVSNYAKRGFRSRHNVNYWERKPYLGLGPSAHSFRDGVRSWNVPLLDEYIRTLQEGTLPVAGEERLTAAEEMEEIIFLGMRQGKIDLREIEARFNIAAERRWVDRFREWEGLGLIRLDEGRVLLTRKGLLMAEELAERLV